MNERIRELAEQAFFDEATSEPSNKMYTFSDHKMKKFAELIVRDCLTKISESLEAANINLLSRPEDDYWLGFRHACDDNLTDIKQHFGVEE